MASTRLVQLTLDEMKTLMGIEEQPCGGADASRLLFQPVRQSLPSFFSRLEPGDPAGAVYGSPGELRSLLGAFIRARQERGDSDVVLLASDRLREAVAALGQHAPGLTAGLRVVARENALEVEPVRERDGPMSGPVCLIREPMPSEAKAELKAYRRQQDELERRTRTGRGLVVLDLFSRSLPPPLLKAAVLTHRQLVLAGRAYPNSRYTPAASYAERAAGPVEVGRLMAGIEHDHLERLRTDFLEHILTGTGQPFAAYGPDGRLLACNSAFCRLTGYDVDEIRLLDLEADLVPEDLRAQALALRRDLLAHRHPCRAVLALVDKSGRRVPVQAVSDVKPGPDNEPELIYTFFTDLRDKPPESGEAGSETMRNDLTGLPSRALFLDRLAMSLARARRHEDYRLAVLAVGFDRPRGPGGPGGLLDQTEETGAGEFLRSAAQRIGKSLRSMDSATRLDGSGFAVLLEDLGDEIDGVRVARRVQAELCAPFRLRGRELSCSCSIGMAYASPDQDQPESLVRAAMEALDRAVAKGVRRIEISGLQRHDQAMRFLRLEADIERALSSSELTLRYQPILTLEDRIVRGFEVFVRWDHPELGLLAPDEFIPMVEAMDCADVVETWVVREACRQLKAWRAVPGGEGLFVSLNISGRNLLRSDFLGRIEDVLAGAGLSPADIRLESRERIIAEHPDTAGPSLAALAARGIDLYLDDFGKGSSSMVLLHSLPIAGLKVPASCLAESGLAHSIAVLAGRLRLDVVWKHVETRQELDLLATLGSRSAQGNLFSPPLTGGDAGALLGRPLAWDLPAPP